jgi:hypothetical protein
MGKTGMGEEKRDGNTEFTEGRTQRAQGQEKKEKREGREEKGKREERLRRWSGRAHPSLKSAKDGAPSSTWKSGAIGEKRS